VYLIVNWQYFFQLLKNTSSYWDSAVCPSPGILNTRKQRFGNWTCFCPQVRADRHLLCGFPEKELTSVQWLRLTLCKGAKRTGVSPPLTWGRKQIQFPKGCVLHYWDFRAMGTVQISTNSVRHHRQDPLYSILKNTYIPLRQQLGYCIIPPSSGKKPIQLGLVIISGPNAWKISNYINK
jgi:hypothetical protein